MANPPAPAIDCRQLHTTAAVSDLRKAIDFYTKKLGFKLAFTWGDPPTFAGVLLDQVQIFLQQATPQPDGFEMIFVIGNADELYEFHKANGVRVVEEIGDREYGMRDYRVLDQDGNQLSFGQHSFTTGPKVEIERVDVSGATRKATRCASI